MDKRLHNLQLVLEQLDVGTDIDSIDRRVTLQKAVYLAQEAGIPLLYPQSTERMNVAAC